MKCLEINICNSFFKFTCIALIMFKKYIFFDCFSNEKFENKTLFVHIIYVHHNLFQLVVHNTQKGFHYDF